MRAAVFPLWALLMLSGCSRLLCDDDTFKEAPQPGGALVARAVLRNCGATTDFTTHVFLGLPNSGNTESVLVVKGNANGLALLWQGDRRLLIACHQCARENVIRFVAMSGAVDITLER